MMAGWEGALAEIESCFKRGGKYISDVDWLKINAWEDTPSDELYLKYKNEFDNPKYYNQKTVRIRWSKNDGFLSGTRVDNVMVSKGTLFKRCGDLKRKFLN